MKNIGGLIIKSILGFVGLMVVIVVFAMIFGKDTPSAPPEVASSKFVNLGEEAYLKLKERLMYVEEKSGRKIEVIEYQKPELKDPEEVTPEAFNDEPASKLCVGSVQSPGRLQAFDSHH